MLTREQITEALRRLGALAQAQGDTIQLIAIGGTALVLAYGARSSTRDVDAVILAPGEMQVRVWALDVAEAMGLSIEWFNDAARIFLTDRTPDAVLLEAPGIVVYRPAVAQLLAMKLSAWRDEIDQADARLLYHELMAEHAPHKEGTSSEEIWQRVRPYLFRPQEEARAYTAFLTLVEGDDGGSGSD